MTREDLLPPFEAELLGSVPKIVSGLLASAGIASTLEVDRFASPERGLDLAVLLFGLSALIWIMDSWRAIGGQVSAVAGLAGLIFLAGHWFALPGWAGLLTIPIGLAAGLLGLGTATVMAGLATALILALALAGVAPLAGSISGMVTVWGTLAVLLLILRPSRLLVEWTLAQLERAHIEYESGAVANFMLNYNYMGPRAGRNLHAIGTHGRIWGNLAENVVLLHENLSGKTTQYDTSGDGSGHGGGDRLHALLLRRMMQEPAFQPEQSAMAGYLSAVMCFASDLSRREQRRVDLSYGHDGLVTFS